MPPKLKIWDQRMLQLMDHCKETGAIKTNREFFDVIGFNETGLRKVKAGTQSFTTAQLVAAARKYNVNMNWMAGLEDHMNRRGNIKKANGNGAINHLKKSLVLIEAEFGK